jgi:hypothetical protein
VDLTHAKKLADKLFEKRSPILSMWQELAEHFYPERAEFTTTRQLGAEFGANLMSSYPQLARRDLADSFASLLPLEEFEMTVAHEEDIDQEGKAWLERSTKIMRRAMLDPVARMDRAKKEGDHDYATFGQCVISIELNRARTALLFRAWHLRDVVWMEDAEGEITYVCRKWKPFAKDLVDLFPKTVSKKVRELAAKDPFAEVDVYHIVCKSSHYSDAKLTAYPWVSTYMECQECHLLEQQGQHNRHYIVPRWQTMSGSQYAISPATAVALPDARLIQDMMRVLLEAGEKAVNPPMIAFSEAIRSDIGIYAGGITWAEKMADDRFGDPIKLLTNDKSGIPLGLEMHQDTRLMIREAFFLSKLTMPAPSKQMTAYEVGQRVSEWTRQSLPLFRPTETGYNGAWCEATFDLLARNGGFGPIDQIPQSLQNGDVRFKFKTPLREVDGEKAAIALQRSRELLDMVADIDQRALHVVDFAGSYRAAVQGVGMEQRFIRGPEVVDRMAAQTAAQQAAVQEAAQAESGARTLKDMATAEKLSKAA